MDVIGSNSLKKKKKKWKGQEMVYQEVKEANQYANIILNGQEKEKAI